MAQTNDTTTRIRYGIVFTKSLGSFESIKIELNVDDYVRKDDDEKVSEAYERISKFVDARVEAKVVEIVEDMK